ncbi:integrin alpha-PS5-like [Anticarsia gemmatalis]|uniref:integrin alpha-PS5-like n=1 Tax=Anticarsia gemmatalis TaxID=129554 RepID=UPI003F7768E2
MHLILLLLAPVAWGRLVDFYHERSVEEFLPPVNLRENSYFGYSTTYDAFNEKLIISAPRQNNVGEVYECDVNTHECSKLAHHIRREYNNYKHDYWFGATVKAGSDFVMACAPSFTRYSNFNGQTQGRCFTRRAHGDTFESNATTVKLKGDPRHTLGWSLDIGPGDSIIIGGSTVALSGGIVTISTPQYYVDSIIGQAFTRYGYSVASGYFTGPNSLSYAVGATFGTDGTGAVYIISVFGDFEKKYYTSILEKRVDSNVIGSMFGAVLCAAQLTDTDSKYPTDLIVGAPTYAAKSGYNSGAVYIYVYSNIINTLRYKKRLLGGKDGALFGSAIAAVGDLNGDGKDEVALAAPFEDDGRGAVYLYSGADLADKEETSSWLQRIVPASDHRSFGLSLTTLKDYDENGCNELVIGAPYENKVMLYKCMAAVTITKIYAVFPKLQNLINLNKTEGVFEVCIDVEYPSKPEHVVAVIATEVQINHPDVKLAKPNKNELFYFETPLHDKQPQYCQPVDFTLPQKGDYEIEIRYGISTKLLYDPMEQDTFDGTRVVLSDKSVLTNTGAVWAAECAGIKECKPKLSMTYLYVMEEPFVIGSEDVGVFNIFVDNKGDIAYDPCLQVKVSGATISNTPVGCVHHLDETLECAPRKHLRNNGDDWVISNIMMDLTALTNQDREIAVGVTLFERCKNKAVNVTEETNFSLISSPEDVYIDGLTNVGEVVNVTNNDLLYYGKHFEHIYKIINNGPNTFVGLAVEVKIEIKKFIKYANLAKAIHVDGMEIAYERDIKCRIDSQNNSTLTMKCEIQRLVAHGHVKVIVPLYILPGTLHIDDLSQEAPTVNTNIVLHIEGLNRTHSISTLLVLEKAIVELWMIIVAGLIGLFLLIILIFSLYECGFLQRKKKNDLQELKRQVTRQTVLKKQSTTNQDTSCDRQKLSSTKEWNAENR